MRRVALPTRHRLPLLIDENRRLEMVDMSNKVKLKAKNKVELKPKRSARRGTHNITLPKTSL